MTRALGRRRSGGAFEGDQVDQLRIDHLARYNVFRFIGPLSVNSLALWIAWDTADRVSLIGWYLLSFPLLWLLYSLTALRVRTPQRYRPAGWERRWIVVTASLSLQSSSWWLLFAPRQDFSHVVLLVMLCLTIWSSAAAVLAGSDVVYVAYSAPLAVILLGRLITWGGEYRLMGLLGIVVAACVGLFQRSIHDQVLEQIHDRLHYRLLASRQELVFETMAEALVVTVGGRITQSNQRFADLAGLSRDQLEGSRLADLVLGDENGRPLPAEVPGDGTPILVTVRRGDGSTAIVEAKGRILAGVGSERVWICTDVTGRLADAAALQRLAERDHLTGVLNRRALTERLEEARSRDDENAGILLIDLDGFKAVNDHNGHSAGDRVLEVITGRITGVLRNDAVVGRLGGDEFMVVAHDLRSAEDLQRIADRVCAACRNPVPIGATSLAVTASIGLALLVPNLTLSASMAEADRNMYAAKRAGGDRWVGPGSQHLVEHPAHVRSS